MNTKIVAFAVCGLMGLCGLSDAGETEKEIEQVIVDSYKHTAKTLGMPDSYSKDGALEFWSSGGLMEKVSGEVQTELYDSFSLRPKHINVITLVEGQAAVALFYAEGSMKPKGYPAVTHYLTRVTQVFVKEDGKWKIRSSHWSPVAGGSGTTLTAVEE